MDPITQGALGASLSQSASSRGKLLAAGVLGALAGMAADLDVFIRSPDDPLLFLEYHRQFSHSLVFVPVGALLCAAVLHVFVRRRLRFRETYASCLLGYATHGLLDACTSYGTMLLWPFSDARIAWNVVSVIDPVLTLVLLAILGSAAWRRSPALARVALAWVVAYLAVGALQHQRALEEGANLAHARGHVPERLTAKPSFGNIVVWRLIYRHEDRFYVDAVRLGVGARLFPGDSVAALDLRTAFPWLDPASQQARDVERFRRFSDGYVALDPRNPRHVTDVRYAMVPHELEGLWAVALDPDAAADRHVRFVTTRADASAKADELLAMLLGR